MQGLTPITVLVTLLAIVKRSASACGSNDECDAGYACVTSPFSGFNNCYPASCEDGWVLEGAKCFFFSTEETNWNGANEACVSKGAALAEIYDEKTNNFFLTEAQQRSEGYFWLGASDKAVEGTWAWNSGAPWEFSDWLVNQPDDDNGEDCLHAYSNSYGVGWNDWSCEGTTAYLCEIDAYVEFDPCEGNPCANGGTCIPGDDGSITCSCPPNTTGISCELTCPEGWILWENNCFFFSSEETNWDAANTACANKDATLAEIYDEEMNTFFLGEAEKREDRFFWLGGSDKAEEGTWRWNAGPTFDYTGWKANQPDDDGGEDCLHAYWRSGGAAGWNDWGCENIGAYLCQKLAS